ncbi:MAG: hypothetical protein FIA92_09700 [Chloroflexi bacterium]|nr:hypothetical protein [Chloroflexota bacterium]
MLRAVLAARAAIAAGVSAGRPLAEALDRPDLLELRRIREWRGDDVAARLEALVARLERAEDAG